MVKVTHRLKLGEVKFDERWTQNMTERQQNTGFEVKKRRTVV